MLAPVRHLGIGKVLKYSFEPTSCASPSSVDTAQISSAGSANPLLMYCPIERLAYIGAESSRTTSQRHFHPLTCWSASPTTPIPQSNHKTFVSSEDERSSFLLPYRGPRRRHRRRHRYAPILPLSASLVLPPSLKLFISSTADPPTLPPGIAIFQPAFKEEAELNAEHPSLNSSTSTPAAAAGAASATADRISIAPSTNTSLPASASPPVVDQIRKTEALVANAGGATTIPKEAPRWAEVQHGQFAQPADGFEWSEVPLARYSSAEQGRN